MEKHNGDSYIGARPHTTSMATCTRYDGKRKVATTITTGCTVTTSTYIGFVKCNLDAAIRMKDNNFHFIAAMTANKESEMTTSEAEVWSLNQGIR
jgi:hypothetical protein